MHVALDVEVQEDPLELKNVWMVCAVIADES